MRFKTFSPRHGSRTVPPRAALALLLMVMTGRAVAATVLMISVDGMKPEYVTNAAQHGLRIPFLCSMLAEGAYAEGVEGVWPTSTYPSHTTLLTGVSPSEHGIYNNIEFDPRRTFGESWSWYASQIRVPTLWQLAHAARMTTASIGWPVSVGATDVDFLIPEYWRNFRQTQDLNPTDRELISALSRPEGLLAAMQPLVGPYLMGNDTSLAADEIKTRYAIDIMRKHQPRLMTVHLSSLDSVEHEHGPFSAEANADLEAIDGMLQRLVLAARANDPDAVAIVVSDHGFASLRFQFNLYVPFQRAGLIDAEVDPDTKMVRVKSWKAQPWSAGGMAAIVQRDPADEQTRKEVRELLRSLAAEPRNGIGEILEGEAIARRGGFPGASFIVVMQPGVYTAGSFTAPLLTDMTGHGGHGFTPSYPDMRAAFFATGHGIARHKNLGLIDMRQIAPTVAQFLDLSMPSATRAPLAVRQ